MLFGISRRIWHNDREMTAQKKINFVIHTALLAVFILGLLTVSAYAQKRLKFSNTEDVAIAFYKTGKVVPNFEKWIKEREPYKITPWAGREEMMAQEKSRLQLAYRNFNPENDYLLIRTFVDVKPVTIKQTEGENTYTLNATFTQAPGALYFPYDFLGDRIIVMPNKIDKFMNSALSTAEFNRITKAKGTGKATMIARLKATESDMSRPYDIDGLKQWVMKADIVTLEIWNKNSQLLWEYSAPWYISPNVRVLNNLYSEQPVQSPQQGSVKSLPIIESK